MLQACYRITMTLDAPPVYILQKLKNNRQKLDRKYQIIINNYPHAWAKLAGTPAEYKIINFLGFLRFSRASSRNDVISSVCLTKLKKPPKKSWKICLAFLRYCPKYFVKKLFFIRCVYYICNNHTMSLFGRVPFCYRGGALFRINNATKTGVFLWLCKKFSKN
jgi:hypothetical protein